MIDHSNGLFLSHDQLDSNLLYPSVLLFQGMMCLIQQKVSVNGTPSVIFITFAYKGDTVISFCISASVEKGAWWGKILAAPFWAPFQLFN